MVHTLRCNLLEVLEESSRNLITVSWGSDVLQFYDTEPMVEMCLGEEIDVEITQEAIQLQVPGRGKSTALNRISCVIEHIKQYGVFTWIDVRSEGRRFSAPCPTEFTRELGWESGMRLEAVLPNTGKRVQIHPSVEFSNLRSST